MTYWTGPVVTTMGSFLVSKYVVIGSVITYVLHVVGTNKELHIHLVKSQLKVFVKWRENSEGGWRKPSLLF